jgi:ADP-ribose pyrophosphatase YjhB (NUDIX family)
MNYCSHCGNKVSLKIPEGDTIPRFVCESCGRIHYQNPRMVVGCIPVWQNKILLCKRAIEPRYGKWTIPAGFLENNETVEQGAIRETIEESGADVSIVRLHSLYSLPHVNQVYAIFLADMNSENFKAGDETLECKLYEISDIPWDEIAFTAVHFSLKKYMENIAGAKGYTFLGQLTIKKNE